MLLFSKVPSEKEKKKRRRKINKKSADNPEFLGVVYEKCGWVFNPAVEEQQAVDDDQDGFHGCREGVEVATLAVQKINDRNGQEGDRADNGYVFKALIFD